LDVSSSKRKTVLLPNDGVLPTVGIFTECYEENFLLNGVFLPNSAHRSVSFMYQFLVLTRNVASVKFVVANGVHTATTAQWWRAAERAQCMEGRSVL
jgi:hypothetical protein